MSFTQDAYTVSEEDGIANICVELTGGLLKRNIEVFVTTTAGSAFGKPMFILSLHVILAKCQLIVVLHFIQTLMILKGS